MIRSNKILFMFVFYILLFSKSFSASDEDIYNKIDLFGEVLDKVLKEYNVEGKSFLDIGCSNGFILEKALELGFRHIKGVEPSLDAIEKALPNIKPFIINGMFDKKKFEKESFDMITFFQTFDHIAEPNIFLKSCFDILENKGFILAINHNANSLSAKILGEKSPIIDIP